MILHVAAYRHLALLALCTLLRVLWLALGALAADTGLPGDLILVLVIGCPDHMLAAARVEANVGPVLEAWLLQVRAA